MDGIYYVVKRKSDGRCVGPAGVSKAPHLYETRGRAEARRKSRFREDDFVVVPVHLTELKQGVQV